MRSPLTRRAPARSAMASMRPSTWAGTPREHRARAGCPCARARTSARGRGCRRCRRAPRPPPALAARSRRPRRGCSASPRPAASGCEHCAAHADDGADSTISSSTRCRNRNSTRPAATPACTRRDERREHARAGAPGDVEARHRVAVAGRGVAAALGPADDGEERARPSRAATRASRRRRTRGRPRPSARPQSSSSRSNPALPNQSCGELERVLHAHASLLGGVDEEQPAERPVRLPAEARLGLLLDDHDALAGVDELGGGDEAREPGADDDRVGLGVIAGRCGPRGRAFGHVDSFVVGWWCTSLASA